MAKPTSIEIPVHMVLSERSRALFGFYTLLGSLTDEQVKVLLDKDLRQWSDWLLPPPNKPRKKGKANRGRPNR